MINRPRRALKHVDQGRDPFFWNTLGLEGNPTNPTQYVILIEWIDLSRSRSDLSASDVRNEMRKCQSSHDRSSMRGNLSIDPPQQRYRIHDYSYLDMPHSDLMSFSAFLTLIFESLSLVLQLSSSNLKQIVLICRSWLRRSRPISSISLRLKESNFYPKKGRTTVSRGVRKSSTGNGLHLITKYRFNGHVVSESSNFFRSKEEWQELGSAFKAIHQIRKGRRSLFPQNKR